MKVYIPTMDELEQLQSLGINIYKYILAKVVETIIMEDIIYEEGDMYEIINYLGEHPEIIYAICSIYPKKISESIITSKDPQLCKKLIEKIQKEDNTIYKLDDILMSFDKSILFEEGIIKSTTNFLAANLSSCPKYRFDYLGPNILLDSIFSCELPISKISTESYESIITIEPMYAVKLGLIQTAKKEKINQRILYLLQRGIAIYTSRYGIDRSLDSEYRNKDIINKPDENIKKLIRCLEYHKQKCQ